MNSTGIPTAVLSGLRSVVGVVRGKKKKKKKKLPKKELASSTPANATHHFCNYYNYSTLYESLYSIWPMMLIFNKKSSPEFSAR